MAFRKIALIGGGVMLMAALGLLPAFLHEKNGGIIALDRPVPSLNTQFSDKEYLMVFVGYVGCRDVCSPRLESLSAIYAGLDGELKQKSGVLFIDFAPEGDPEQAERFARYFNGAFAGISADKAQRQTLRRELDIYFSTDAARPNEYNHSDYLYLLKKEQGGWHLRGVLTGTVWRPNDLDYLFSL